MRDKTSSAIAAAASARGSTRMFHVDDDGKTARRVGGGCVEYNSEKRKRLRRIIPHSPRPRPVNQPAASGRTRTLAEVGSVRSPPLHPIDDAIVASCCHSDEPVLAASTHARRETGTLTCNWVKQRMTLIDLTTPPSASRLVADPLRKCIESSLFYRWNKMRIKVRNVQ